MDIIFSHGSCPDGFVAAMIAKRRYPEAEVIFLDHGADHTENLKKAEGKRVLMLDFSLRTREENDTLAASCASFGILDHHKSAREVLESAPYAIFDMTRSGAGLAWDYLFGKESCPFDVGNPRPWYVDYVEDRDLWNWKLENSREVCAYLGTLPLEFEAWKFLNKIDPYTAYLRGTGALAHINHYVREATKQTQWGQLDGNFVGARADHRASVLQGANAAARGERDRKFGSYATNGFEKCGTPVARSGDVEDHQFIGAFGVVAGGKLGGVAGVAESDEVDAFYDAGAVDVEARDDAVGQAHVFGLTR